MESGAGGGAGKPPPKGRDWFSDLFGFAETSYEEAKRWLRVEVADGGAPGGAPSARVVSLANSEAFNAGSFETPSLAELRQRAGDVKLPGRLRVTNVLGDVGAKIALRENRLATFQVASQFNCLEMVWPSVVPEEGVTGYVRDKTQGPCCSIACGPATVFRNYFAAVGDQVGQTRDRQIDNLADVGRVLGNEPPGRFFEMRNGYSMCDDEKRLQELIARVKELDKAGRLDLARDALRVGVHSDAQVTSSNWGAQQIRDPEQVVSQVFGSALAVAYNRSTRRDTWAPFARLVLNASFEATLYAGLLAAARHGGAAGSNRVFLTALGGGVFGNSMEWISQAMGRAFEICKEFDLDVRIVTYGGAIDPRLAALEKKYPPA